MDANASVIAQYVEQIARGSESTQLYALDQLRALSSGATRNKNAIREYGAIPHIVAALKKPPQSSMVPASALSLLRSLSVNERNQVAIADAGAIPLLFQCLQSPKEAVQANAAAVLWNLASDSENKATIGDTGGVQMLLRLLQRARSVRVQTEVCGALRNLSYRYENLEYFVRQEGGVATMTDVLMLRGNESSEVRKNVAVTLNMCMQHPRTRREIERANCMPTLLRTLREFSIELTPETAQELALLENGAPSALLPQPPLVPHQELQRRRGSMQSPALPVESLAPSPALRTLDVFGSIAWSGLELETIIGKGSFSEVYRARYNGFVVAAKLLTERMPEDKRKREQLLQEHRMLAALKHPNVILLMGTSLSPDAKPVFVFELCARGALKDVLPNERSMLRRLKFGKDIVAGLNWLHAHNIVHRDLKCANILVDEEYKAKISDLGLALLYYDGVVCEHFKGTFFFWFFSFFCLFTRRLTVCDACCAVAGNIKYSAPEILRARASKRTRRYPYGPQTDVYSFGLILWELVTRQSLFQGIHGTSNITAFVCDGHRPALVPGWPMSLQNMLSNCWHDNPSRRPRFIAIQRDFPAVMVDVMCPDPVARKVCRELWRGTETRPVLYSEFETAFQKITHVDLNSASLCYRRCLQRMLCDSYDHCVTFERVCNMVHTFGSMQPIEDFLHRVITLFEQPWFFGYVRVCDARQMLHEQWSLEPAAGYYMVRFSDTMPGSFSLLTIDASGAVERRRIGHQYSSEYFVTIGESEHVFRTLFALHQFCAQSNEVCGGKQPLPGSPFQCLFASNPLQESGADTGNARQRTIAVEAAAART